MRVEAVLDAFLADRALVVRDIDGVESAVTGQSDLDDDCQRDERSPDPKSRVHAETSCAGDWRAGTLCDLRRMRSPRNPGARGRDGSAGSGRPSRAPRSYLRGPSEGRAAQRVPSRPRARPGSPAPAFARRLPAAPSAP